MATVSLVLRSQPFVIFLLLLQWMPATHDKNTEKPASNHGFTALELSEAVRTFMTLIQ